MLYNEDANDGADSPPDCLLDRGSSEIRLDQTRLVTPPAPAPGLVETPQHSEYASVTLSPCISPTSGQRSFQFLIAS